ncbi:MAG: AAA family ATPase, partial [Pirellulales bacterium]
LLPGKLAGGHHGSQTVEREQVILDESTLQLLERNLIRFVAQRDQLRAHGMSTKRGLLFYGPSGTGKTHTIRYLLSKLPGHTSLLVTAEQIGLLEEYLSLARLLEPAIVVLEDVDLIARKREQQGPCLAGCGGR